MVAHSCNPATWRLGLLDGLRTGALLSDVLCRSGVRTKPGINMAFSWEHETSRLTKEGSTGSGGKPSRQNSPCHAVVGSHL
ncbi:nuclear export mediator factor [Biomphalaria pfeifferi]|uniref:Nuclear export mediator factor n=1 Tax=Biomphalaria pfeifferi TaxID=112525 RepID=A0AAD8FG75_BIOPF|nr:nuclear export mediator factor [Biomphalaria pfeifferi]